MGLMQGAGAGLVHGGKDVARVLPEQINGCMWLGGVV